MLRRKSLTPNREVNPDWSEIKSVTPKLFALAVEENKLLILGTFALAGGAAINLLFPALIRSFLKGELGWTLEQDLPKATLLLILLFVVQAGFFYFRHLTFSSVGIRVVYRLRERLFGALLRQEVAFFDNEKSAELLSRITADCQLIQNAVSVNISVFLRYGLQVIGGLVMMALVSLKLMAMIAICVPLFFLGARFWGARLQTAARLMQNALGQSSVIAGERLSGIRIVKIFRAVEDEVNVYAKSLVRAKNAGLMRVQIAAQFSSVMVFLMHSTIAVIFFVGASMVLKHELDLGDLAAFLLYAAIVAASFGFLVGVVDEFLLAVGGASRVFELLTRKPEIVAGTKGGESLNLSAPHIVFDAVGFSYGEEGSRNVALENISFEVRRGGTVAFVGPSGAGKTTILSLLTRFYQPNAGNIFYSGVNIADLKQSVLLSEISVVTQQPILFSGTIADNIRYAKEGATELEIKDAAERANLGELLRRLPLGLNTEIGEQGVKLSGGERQRVTIARAILKNPSLLLLDEATSSLDSKNEHLVQQALQALMQDRTTIIIAHRLSTVQHADQILVVQSGRIMERGDHGTLMSSGGLYASLVQYQLL